MTQYQKALEMIAEKFKGLLEYEGYKPVWTGIGTVFCVEFEGLEEAERCAAWLRSIGRIATVTPGDDDIGPCVALEFEAVAA